VALAVLAMPAAGQCRISYGGYQVYHTPTYASQAYYPPPTYAPNYSATVLVGVPVVYPAFGVGYAQNYGQYVGNGGEQQQSALRDLKDELGRERQRSDFLMQLFLGNRNPPVQQVPPQQSPGPPVKNDLPPQAKVPLPNGVHPGIAVANLKCAKCHDATTRAKGGGLALTTGGGRATITDAAYKALAKAILKGTMPPASENVKLADDEGTALLDVYAQ